MLRQILPPPFAVKCKEMTKSGLFLARPSLLSSGHSVQERPELERTSMVNWRKENVNEKKPELKKSLK